MSNLKDKRVVVMGLGRFGGGVGAARFCARQGARVLVTDQLAESDLAEPIERLSGLSIDYRLGGHDESDFRDADLIVVNPGVDQRNNPYLRAARDAGVPTTTEIRLLLERLPNHERTIGVTGTAGKSTTVAMIGHILASVHGSDHVFVGGNIGGSLLDSLDRIGPEDWVVLELSSFMLDLIESWSPHIAVVTNIADNHLDRHGTMSEYLAAKQKVLVHQGSEDVAVLSPTLAEWRMLTPAARCRIADPSYEGPLLVPGDHNQANASAATQVCVAAGVPAERCAAALALFAGLPHRLQMVAEHNGVRYFNDSKCTTPEAAILAIDSFEPQTSHIILGGYDKHADLNHVALHAARFCKGVYSIGQTGEAIADAVVSEPSRCAIHRCGTLESAVRHAVDNAKPGEVVLMSPACASWDQFDNYEERGRAFAEAVVRFTDKE